VLHVKFAGSRLVERAVAIAAAVAKLSKQTRTLLLVLVVGAPAAEEAAVAATTRPKMGIACRNSVALLGAMLGCEAADCDRLVCRRRSWAAMQNMVAGVHAPVNDGDRVAKVTEERKL
jgi:predicted phosphoribosyltransferase